MRKIVLILIALTFTLYGCHGCSFIKERLGIKEAPKQDQQYQDQEKGKSGPIPINPQHS
ncbi:MAG: hypothetical protein HYY52_06715 [Candidatus Melainabacteria bacterium]|nr:hypothetical protein [Candidatus Melainabacteria bacterium]